jgi:hypothetical protein
MHNIEQAGCRVAEECGRCYGTYINGLIDDINNNNVHDALKCNEKFFEFRNKAIMLGCEIASDDNRDTAFVVNGHCRVIVEEAVANKS